MAAFMEISTTEDRRQRTFRLRTDPFNDFTCEEFYRRYRFTKDCVRRLALLLGSNLQPKTRRNHPVSPELQLLAALRFYATGSYQLVAGDTLGLSQPTISRIVTKVSEAIASRSREFIYIPEGNDLSRVKQDFTNIAGFPGVVMCVDGTHIRIERPRSRDDDFQFINRKNFYSVNVQVACDANCRFTNIVVQYPGSTHDSFILRNSEMYAFFESSPSHGIVLGDSAYPCRWWLMTPFPNPHSLEEKRYNKAHMKTRVKIENAIGQWKRRFGLLHQESRRHLKNVAADVIACAVLHNYAKDNNLPDFDELEIEVPEVSEPNTQENSLGNGFERRRTLAHRISLNYS